MQTYRDLIAWQRSVKLVKAVYVLTELFPSTEKYGLTSQIRRSATSIPANIAEGYARKHRSEYIQFLRIAFGSGAELETHLIVAKELGIIKLADNREAESLLNEVMRLLSKLIASLSTP